jgi:hypothetical protein
LAQIGFSVFQKRTIFFKVFMAKLSKRCAINVENEDIKLINGNNNY